MGGAVATDLDADLTLVDCEFTANTGGSGGAVCVSVGTATILGCSISECLADFGAGVCMMSATGVDLIGTTIEGCDAGFQGGGLYASDSHFEAIDCDVSANTSVIQGGGAHLLNSTGVFSRCRFDGNSSSGDGDGLYLCDSGATVHAGEFMANGEAIHVCGYARAPIDARWNWWGDSSGPYHPTTNPLGTGDEVTGGVNYSPWNAVSSCEGEPSQVRRSWGAIKAAYR